MTNKSLFGSQAEVFSLARTLLTILVILIFITIPITYLAVNKILTQPFSNSPASPVALLATSTLNSGAIEETVTVVASATDTAIAAKTATAIAVTQTAAATETAAANSSATAKAVEQTTTAVANATGTAIAAETATAMAATQTAAATETAAANSSATARAVEQTATAAANAIGTATAAETATAMAATQIAAATETAAANATGTAVAAARVTPIFTPTPTPLPTFSAVIIDDKPTEQEIRPDGKDHYRVLRWWPWSDKAPDGWYYVIRFLPQYDPNAAFKPVMVPLNAAIPGHEENEGWLVFSFDILTLPNDPRSCYPYWDVMIGIDADRVNCPKERIWDGICRLSAFSKQRSLETARPNTCLSSDDKGSDEREGSTSDPVDPCEDC